MINDLAQKIYANAKDKGFYEDGKANNIGERLCLIHSEVSEALEADRKNNHADKLAANDVLLFPDAEIFKEQFKLHVKDTFEDEIADVEMAFGHVLLYRIDQAGKTTSKETRHIDTTPPHA